SSPLGFYFVARPPPRPTLFPYTTLFRSHIVERGGDGARQFEGFGGEHAGELADVAGADDHAGHTGPVADPGQRHRERGGAEAVGDRKSTRLNSSHVKISYAVFCLKKKKE